MEDDRPLTRNAADPKQVKFAGRTEKGTRESELDDLRQLLATEPGRRFIWRVLGYCRVWSDSFDVTTNVMAFNAGMQNVGNFILGDVRAAEDEALFLMMRENRARQRKQAADAEAMRTKSANEGVRDED